MRNLKNIGNKKDNYFVIIGPANPTRIPQRIMQES